jgi:hypothetical protein
VARRLYCAYFDLVITRFLQGYKQLTGRPVGRAMGPVALLFIRALSAMDDELDRRLATGMPTSEEQILESAVVRHRLGMWDRYAIRFDADGEFTRLLCNAARAKYRQYLELISRPCFRSDPEALMAAISIDSGDQLRWLYRIIALFSGHDLSEEAEASFFALGVAGKIADDILDFEEDWRRDRSNLVYALLLADSVELSTVTGAMESGHRLTLRWWRRNCPRTLSRLESALTPYWKEVISGHHRQAVELMVLPGMLAMTRRSDAAAQPVLRVSSRE